jgi:hypothetical protein
MMVVNEGFTMPRLIDDPAHWRKCAFEARAKAVHMETEERRRIMLRIADESRIPPMKRRF